MIMEGRRADLSCGSPGFVVDCHSGQGDVGAFDGREVG